MSMISKQIDDLRAYAKDRKGELAKLVSDAADTIEMLSAKLSMRLPSAQPEQRWIPCSERLPDKNGKYLVVGRQKAINILKFDGGRWYGKWGVVAWIPIPEPYKAESEDKE